nr:g-type lectin s-receptor-like serine/threonine-protein kinase [Quercus suber]
MNSRISPLIAFLLLFFSLGFQSTNNTVTDTILPGQPLTHPETIVSPNGIFELCFFSPGNSTKYYLAIRFKNVSEQSVVWVANRKYPFPDSTAALNINQDGDLVISDGTMTYAMTNTSAGNGTYAMLLDTGNLILTNRVLEVFWQSFDYPTDTLLPGMKLIGYVNASLISWKSREDPAPGLFYLQWGFNIYSTAQPIIKIMEGSEVYWTSLLTSFDVLSYDYLGYVSWPINYTSQTQISRIVLHESGKLKLQSWLEDKKKWNSSLQSSRCGDYALCGNFSVCNETAQEPCGCLPGFKPVSAGAWTKGGVSSGCERKTALQCSNNNSDIQNDGFLLMSKVDWLDNPKPLEMSSNRECQSSCLNSCSCIAYAFEEKFGPSRTKSDCIEWHGSFSYLKLPSIEDAYGNDFYLKLAPLELDTHDPSSRNESNPAATPGAIDGVMLVRAKQLVAILAISLPLATLLLGIFVYCVWKKLRMASKGEDLVQLDLGMTIKSENSELLEENKRGGIRKKEVKMPLFSFTSVSAATDNFSDANKLGEGGFGPVYKAWELWTSDRGSDLVDPLLDDVSSVHAALKYVNIGLLCVQESAADRPTMSDVVAMLSSESTALPYPKQPAFLNMKSVMKANPGISRTEICSVNHATVSIIEGR